MKRVLNSGSIKLPYITGSEKDLLNNAACSYGIKDLNLLMPHIFQVDAYLKQINFTFEIKMPVLVAQSFYYAHLGALKAQEGLDHQVSYLPAQYWKQDPSGFLPMSPKDSNELNTKLNNFYNWSFNFYNKMVEGGLCKEQAQLVLPQGLFKTYLWEVNAKDLISFIEQNHSKSPEMAGYCNTLVLYMEDHLPQVTSYLKRNQWKDLI